MKQWHISNSGTSQTPPYAVNTEIEIKDITATSGNTSTLAS